MGTIESRPCPEGFVEVVVCPDCSEAFEEGDVDKEPLYECGNCGNSFPMSEGDGGGWSNNRCPDCGKYASRVGDCHADCGGNLDEFSSAYKCEECDETIDSTEECATHKADEHPEEDEDDGADERPRKAFVPTPVVFKVVEVDKDGHETVTTEQGA